MGRGGSYNPAVLTMLGGLRRCAGEGPFDRSSTARSPPTFDSHRDQPMFRKDMIRVAWVAYPAPEGRKGHKRAGYFTCLR